MKNSRFYNKHKKLRTICNWQCCNPFNCNPRNMKKKARRLVRRANKQKLNGVDHA